MKIQKTITIDVEVFLKLQEKQTNLSKLINDYLKEFLGIKENEAGKRVENIKSEIIKLETMLLSKKKIIDDLELQRGKEDKEKIEREGIPFELPHY